MGGRAVGMVMTLLWMRFYEKYGQRELMVGLGVGRLLLLEGQLWAVTLKI